MNHFIDYLIIDNFKSIRHLQVSGFKRINLFIGRPNVGKSNILEALSVFSIPFMWDGSKMLTDILRVESLREIFYDGNISDQIGVGVRKIDKKQEEFHGTFHRESGGLSLNFRERVENSHNHFRTRYAFVDTKFRVKSNSKNEQILKTDSIKKYTFKSSVQFKETKHTFLQPPFGTNLLHILEVMPELRKLYAQWFRQYDLRLVLETVSQSIKIQKEKGDEVFQLPYSSVADTLQRIIFYKTAVASNENSVLLFEEPEAHAYPPYIVEFTQEVIRSLTNQFFIVTHSPLIVEEFLTDAIDDLGIFMVDFKDGQTVVKGLTTEEIHEVRRYGVDLFFNNEAYLS